VNPSTAGRITIDVFDRTALRNARASPEGSSNVETDSSAKTAQPGTSQLGKVTEVETLFGRTRFGARVDQRADLDDGNLMTTDFRRVYATMIKEWLGYDDTATPTISSLSIRRWT
jgi:hypothetical protein